MSTAQGKQGDAIAAHGLRINGVPELIISDARGIVIATLDLDRHRYRIDPGPAGSVFVTKVSDETGMALHHCFFIDLEGQNELGRMPGRPVRLPEGNNLFNFWFEQFATVDGETSGTLVGIGAVDILDISILDPIDPDPRRTIKSKGSRAVRPGRTEPYSNDSWPNDFPACTSPRVALTYRYPLGLRDGTNGPVLHSLVVGAVLENGPRGEPKANLVVSCLENGLELNVELEV